MTLEHTFYKLFRLCFLLSVLIAQTVFAQGSGTIRGTVSDEITKEKLPGANVIVKIGRAHV